MLIAYFFACRKVFCSYSHKTLVQLTMFLWKVFLSDGFTKVINSLLQSDTCGQTVGDVWELYASKCEAMQWNGRDNIVGTSHKHNARMDNNNDWLLGADKSVVCRKEPIMVKTFFGFGISHLNTLKYWSKTCSVLRIRFTSIANCNFCWIAWISSKAYFW